MKRPLQKITAILMLAMSVGTGCRPQQPFYFGEDGTLSHYVGKAKDIDYPDENSPPNTEVTDSRAPLTLANANFEETWPLSLQEAVKHSLANGKVLRSLGGRFAFEGSPTTPLLGPSPNLLLNNPGLAQTIYDPAIQASSLGLSGTPIGVEAALSEFDAQLTTGLLWTNGDRPLNISNPGVPGSPILQQQDVGSFQAEISKVTAEGSRFFLRNATNYNHTIGAPAFTPLFLTHHFTTNMEAGFSQPLLQGAGAQFNRIAGPFSPLQGIGSRPFDGVVLARINQDITLADFEAGVRNMVFDVENTYWELYFAYRNLETSKVAMQSALKTWQRVKTLGEAGLAGGSAKDEALAREQYYRFKALLETAKSELFGAETRLRYMMGLSPSDGRLIRPSDEPTDAALSFNWCDIMGEALERSVELRRQKWVIKQRDMELIAARNFLLPRLDANGLYRWHGFGEKLIDPGYGGTNPYESAWGSLMDGNFQEWELGLQLSMKLGFRAELAGVRHQQLLLSRAKALLEEQELELSHQVADSVRAMDEFHKITETSFNRRLAAIHQVESLQAVFDAGVDAAGGTHILDLLLEAQRRLAEAEGQYYRSLVDYNRSVAQLHLRKGSLLEYNGIYLAEGPWPAKAYFDALRLGRQRDASLFVDYGFTRPGVISQGPFEQFQGTPVGTEADAVHPGRVSPQVPAEEVPAPVPAEESDDQQAAISGPRLSQARPQSTQSQAKPVEKFQWGSLGLNKTAAKQPKTAPAAGGTSMRFVEPASHEE